MLKRVLNVVITFGLLTAAYAAYVRGFELVAMQLSQNYQGTESEMSRVPSRNEKEKTELAIRAFGAGHWTAEPDTQSYYNADKGFWMYFKDFDRVNEGKQIDFRPFAVIWGSREGKGLKTAISESARVDLDKPLNVAMKPGSNALRVVHAKLEREVHIRDDKGTADTADDLRIGPFTSIEYDEASLQITSDSQVIMDDRDLHLTGIGLLIQLRPREVFSPVGGNTVNTAGFDGAQTIVVKRNVFVAIQDVGDDGILPNPSAAGQRKQGKTPIELRCDLAMRIDLPKPGAPVKIGPPEPTGPTLAHFSRNVEVLRGVANSARDQLHCDNLHLILVPAPKGGAAEADDESETEAEAPVVVAKTPEKVNGSDIELPPAPDAETVVASTENAQPRDKGPLTELTLKQADATGHNVQLVSAANGLKARCNEMIHKKQLPFAPDETYLRGDTSTKVIIEKTDIAADGPEKGKITNYTHIKTIDAKIFDEGNGKNASTIVARGPGEMESHPGINKPVERRARWQDQLTLQDIKVTEKADPKVARSVPAEGVRKLITLTGQPRFEEVPSKTTLDARSTLVLRLKPKAPIEANDVTKDGKGTAIAARTAEGAAAPAKETFEIENLVAIDDVHLIAPGQNLHARNRLDAVFSPDPSIVRAGATTTAKPAANASTKTKTTAPAAAKPAASDGDTSKTKAKPEPEKPPEPSATAIADRVWARVYLKPKEPNGAGPAVVAAGPQGIGGQNADIDKVYLRGNVSFHKDPDIGKLKGTDIKGEAIDLFSQGKTRQGDKLNKFIVYHIDPSPKTVRKTSAPARVPLKDQAAGKLDPVMEDLTPLARVETDEMTIEGEVISLDQASNLAVADGRGSLTTMTNPGLLNEKAASIDGEETDGEVVAEQGRDDADLENLDTEVVQVELADPPARQAKTKDQPVAKTPPKKKTPLKITWKQGMKFLGNSVDQQGRAVAVAEFYEKVHAFTDEADLKCDDVMRVYMDKIVKLMPAKPAPRNPDGTKPPEPARADIATIECVENVVVVNLKFDEATKATVQKQLIEGGYLIYQKATGKFRVPGAGIVYLYEIEKPDDKAKLKVGQAQDADKPKRGPADAKIIRTAGPQSPPLPRPNGGIPAPVVGHGTAGRDMRVLNPDKPSGTPRRPAVPAKVYPLILTTVKFKRDMIGRFGTGGANDKQETRWADFFGDVESIRGVVKNFEATLDPDAPPDGAQFLTAQIMRVISEPNRTDPKAPPRYLLRAWENAYATVDDRTIQADTISFDSKDDKFYAYGLEGRNVVIAQQTQQGQPGSVVDGRAAYYNHKTGASELIDASKISLLDAKTGQRPIVEQPVDPKLKPVRPMRSKFRNPRNSTERKDFRGN